MYYIHGVLHTHITYQSVGSVVGSIVVWTIVGSIVGLIVGSMVIAYQ